MNPAEAQGAGRADIPPEYEFGPCLRSDDIEGDDPCEDMWCSESGSHPATRFTGDQAANFQSPFWLCHDGGRRLHDPSPAEIVPPAVWRETEAALHGRC